MLFVPHRSIKTQHSVLDDQGHRQIRFTRDDRLTRTTVESRELLDVQARLRDMDEMGTDVQVIYPTLFSMEATENPEVSTALRRSYNWWLADRCGESRAGSAGLLTAADEYGRGDQRAAVC